MSNVLVMAGLLTSILLSFRDWVPTAPERRSGLRTTIIAMVFTWLISVVTWVVVDAALVGL